MAVTVEIKKDGETVLMTSLAQRVFSSGKIGYGEYGKVSIGEKRHQLSLNIVEIGSADGKPSTAVANAGSKPKPKPTGTKGKRILKKKKRRPRTQDV